MDGELLTVLVASVALLVRVGLGWYAAGLSRSKNAAGAVLRNAIDLAVAALAFWAVGAAILSGDAGHLFLARSGFASTTTFVYLVLILIGTAPVAGAIMERAKFFPMLAIPALLGGIIIPICARWAWTDAGWLRRMNFFDVGGATVLHVAGGVAAAVAAILVGPRSGKYNRDGSANFIPGHSVPMASVGAMLMLAGWLPYMLAASRLNGGFERCAINVLLSGAAGLLLAAITSNARYGKVDVMLTYSGLLGGLVAVTASAGLVNPIAAVIMGAVAGIITPIATVALDLKFRIDDPAGGVAIHALNGAWSAVALGVFFPAATWAEKFSFLGVQVLGVVVVAAITLVATTLVLIALKKTIGLRLSEDAEYDGTDLAENDLNAYPDFQQTMIKSYHMREA
jgi:Amt family ammonium transporter